MPANSYGGEAIRTSYVPVKQVTGTVTTDWGSNDTADVWLEDYAAAYQGSIGDAHFAWSDYFEYYSFIGYTTYLDQVYLTTAFYNYTDQLDVGDSTIGRRVRNSPRTMDLSFRFI